MTGPGEGGMEYGSEGVVGDRDGDVFKNRDKQYIFSDRFTIMP